MYTIQTVKSMKLDLHEREVEMLANALRSAPPNEDETVEYWRQRLLWDLDNFLLNG